MARLTYLIIHCTATPEGRAVTSDDIRAWHRRRGWKQVGYADIIHLNGCIENMVHYNNDDTVDTWEITNGVQGINSISRHVVYVGGMCPDGRVAKDTRTAAQKMALANYVKQTIAQHTNIKVAGHNQFASKDCPSFDTVKWLKGIGIPLKNIHGAK